MPVSTSARAPRLQAWEEATEWPMAALAVLFLAVFATEVLAQGLSPGWHRALVITDYTIWAIFAVEFLIRLTLAFQRGRYVLRHLPDVAMLALPFLRALRVLRIVPLLRALNRWVADTLRGKFVVYGTTSAVLLVFTGALAVLDAERGQPGARDDLHRRVWRLHAGDDGRSSGRGRRDGRRSHARRRGHRLLRHVAHRPTAG